MQSLTRHHVSRARLMAILDEGTVALVEAGAGYGKSVLAAEFASHLGVIMLEARLGPTLVTPSQMVSRLRAGARRVGLSRTDARMAEAGGDSAGALDSLLESLSGEAAVVVVDDVHHADRDAAI